MTHKIIELADSELCVKQTCSASLPAWPKQ